MAPPKIFLENLIPDPEVFSCVLPPFPVFKKIELSDKEAVEKITRRFPPYSDFNFVSMWSWDVHGNMGICQLNGNFVVRFTDYVTGEPFYSFLGDNKVNETAQAVLELSKKEGLKAELKLVPEVVANLLDLVTFKIQEDRDNFDYTYNIDRLVKYQGKDFETKRNLVNRFLHIYPKSIVKICDIGDKETLEGILKLSKIWEEEKLKESKSKIIENDLIALHRILLASKSLDLTIVGIYSDNQLICFSINEILSEGYVISHFAKADLSSSGSYAFLMKNNAILLQGRGSEYLNYEQDLGELNLRHAKESFRPNDFLKKFICSYN